MKLILTTPEEAVQTFKEFYKESYIDQLDNAFSLFLNFCDETETMNVKRHREILFFKSHKNEIEILTICHYVENLEQLYDLREGFMIKEIENRHACATLKNETEKIQIERILDKIKSLINVLLFIKTQQND